MSKRSSVPSFLLLSLRAWLRRAWRAQPRSAIAQQRAEAVWADTEPAAFLSAK